MELSVIIPAYNEAKRLPTFLTKALDYLDSQFPGNHEIIVVDDGSRDGTSAAVKKVIGARSYFHLIRHELNMGKGAAVRTGMQYTHGRLRLFADADGSTPIQEEQRLRRVIAAGADVAIGSRATRRVRGLPLLSRQLPIDEKVKRDVRLHRYVIGRTFAALTKLILGLSYADTQCGFKMFRRDVADDLFSCLTTERFIFDVEILFLAEKRGLRVAEVPVNWHEVPGSKVQLIGDSWRMFCGLWQIAQRHKTLIKNAAAKNESVVTQPRLAKVDDIQQPLSR